MAYMGREFSAFFSPDIAYIKRTLFSIPVAHFGAQYHQPVDHLIRTEIGFPGDRGSHGIPIPFGRKFFSMFKLRRGGQACGTTRNKRFLRFLNHPHDVQIVTGDPSSNTILSSKRKGEGEAKCDYQ